MLSWWSNKMIILNKIKEERGEFQPPLLTIIPEMLSKFVPFLCPSTWFFVSLFLVLVPTLFVDSMKIGQRLRSWKIAVNDLRKQTVVNFQSDSMVTLLYNSGPTLHISVQILDSITQFLLVERNAPFTGDSYSNRNQVESRDKKVRPKVATIPYNKHKTSDNEVRKTSIWTAMSIICE